MLAFTYRPERVCPAQPNSRLALSRRRPNLPSGLHPSRAIAPNGCACDRQVTAGLAPHRLWLELEGLLFVGWQLGLVDRLSDVGARLANVTRRSRTNLGECCGRYRPGLRGAALPADGRAQASQYRPMGWNGGLGSRRAADPSAAEAATPAATPLTDYSRDASRRASAASG